MTTLSRTDYGRRQEFWTGVFIFATISVYIGIEKDQAVMKGTPAVREGEETLVYHQEYVAVALSSVAGTGHE
jgi:hypothetical protein